MLETSEGAVASSSSPKDMDGIIVVVDFRESGESISSVSFENDDEDDDENKTYSSKRHMRIRMLPRRRKKKRFSKAAS